MKTCTKCQVSKDLSEFYKCAAFRDGLQLWCKACHKAYYRKRGRALRGAVSWDEYQASRVEKATAATRECILCHETKPRRAFHRTKGSLGCTTNICRKCRPDYERARRETLKLDPAWVEKKREQNRVYIRKVRNTPVFKMKSAARKMVSAAVQAGLLVRQSCEQCGEPNTHAHHDDYNLPLQVRWLCPACHGREHAVSP